LRKTSANKFIVLNLNHDKLLSVLLPNIFVNPRLSGSF